MESKVWRVLVVVALVLALAAGVFGVLLPKAQAVPEPLGEQGSRSFATYLSSLTVGGATVLDGAVTINNNAEVTGTLKVAGTPVAVQAGALAGSRLICGSTTITGTGTLPHGLATPQYVQLSLGQNATGDCAQLSYTNASATVTAKCWNTALTPAAATTPAPVNWCVIGTP